MTNQHFHLKPGSQEVDVKTAKFKERVGEKILREKNRKSFKRKLWHLNEWRDLGP